MAASRTFDQILEQIQTSHLNFHLQISPFSAVISLKKSFVKDRSGVPLLPSTPYTSQSTSVSDDIAALAAKNLKLEKDMRIMQNDYADEVSNCEAAYATIKSLEIQIDAAKCVKKESVTNVLEESVKFRKENDDLRRTIDIQNESMNNLEISNKKLRETANKLNKELNETKVKFGKKKKLIYKQHRAEIKSWRKELGEEIKEKIKLEEKLKENVVENDEPNIENVELPDSLLASNSLRLALPTSKETACSICSTTIANYKPKIFLDETFNPACESCDDSFPSDDHDLVFKIVEEPTSERLIIKPNPITPKGFDHQHSTKQQSPSTEACSHNNQCIIRQPFPPPLPAVMPLVNMSSMYHKKIMAGQLDWGSTCAYCMRIDYEKYGCDSCVWIKCFGDLHGFPDLDPYYYKKFL